MIPQPTPACRRQARRLEEREELARHVHVVFVTAARAGTVTSRREAQVVG